MLTRRDSELSIALFFECSAVELLARQLVQQRHGPLVERLLTDAETEALVAQVPPSRNPIISAARHEAFPERRRRMMAMRHEPSQPARHGHDPQPSHKSTEPSGWLLKAERPDQNRRIPRPTRNSAVPVLPSIDRLRWPEILFTPPLGWQLKARHTGGHQPLVYNTAQPLERVQE